MKLFLFVFIVFGLFCSHPLYAKLDITPQPSPSNLQCLAAFGMSSKAQATYTKIGGVIPDIICCSSSVEDRATCLDEKADALKDLATFIDDNFHDPLAKMMSGVSQPGQAWDTCGQWAANDIDAKIKKVKCELDYVGDAFARYQTLLNSVK